ncbi:YraN family protein [Wenzhouxiangella sp. AB-CW3]|uniref:YraN family protein n=1 Tax=Wenzhouxiangella sp. AB-CW3 TaxID=2771012 RepID=UPI00168AC0D7|nr:YraN family protein [Wenzhouxiangella sp. AB-CW3]QOC23419.1 YraN family protein [Wenzhouxiangella sp. AB-CW3]
MASTRGEFGERQAEQWLHGQGLETIQRNYRCRAGEIDLVMLDCQDSDCHVLSFVEVRLRGPGARVDSADSVDVHKQQRLVNAARHFLMCHPEWSEHACRFDVIGIDSEEQGLRWIRDAFEADE